MGGIGDEASLVWQGGVGHLAGTLRSALTLNLPSVEPATKGSGLFRAAAVECVEGCSDALRDVEAALGVGVTRVTVTRVPTSVGIGLGFGASTGLLLLREDVAGLLSCELSRVVDALRVARSSRSLDCVTCDAFALPFVGGLAGALALSCGFDVDFPAVRSGGGACDA